ncbi:Uncharacterised protein [Mycobacteroides abscessus subsp. abscessus]|nr:Uncharacterised protein [Mycobacteroides abscessus subsp. abscessus]
MRHGGVQQRARQLRAGRVTDLEPSTGQQCPRRRSQAQQPSRRAAQQRRTLVEHADSTIHLDSESVG